MSTYSAKVALLASTIDYAGTFPPAALPLEQALKVAATFRHQGRHPWLMAKVALPIADIKKLGSRVLYEANADGAAWLYAALGTPQPKAEEALKTLEWDLRELRRCQERGAGASVRQAIIAYETKPSAEIVDGGKDALDGILAPYLERFASVAPGWELFLEVGFDGEWRRRLNVLGDWLADWVATHPDARLTPGLKFRTGGTLVPTAEQLSAAIGTVTSHGLRFKATQGLHHALTGKEFGFVNLFASLAFAQSLGSEKFGEEKIAECLSETSGKALRLEADALRWNDFSLSLEDIEIARRRHGATFGSCSLDEPDEALATEL